MNRAVLDPARHAPDAVPQEVRWFVPGVLALGLLLRLCFILEFPLVAGDSLTYLELARNCLEHGVLGLGTGPVVEPSGMRMPGYPLFLAAGLAVFGRQSVTAILVLQALLDLGTCLLVGGIARSLGGPRAARLALLLAANCPFLANYSSNLLTETLATFLTAATLRLVLLALEASWPRAGRLFLFSGLTTAAATYVRPDSLFLLFVALTVVPFARAVSRGEAVRCALLLVSGVVVSLLPWTLRNWRVLHVFQPLAPRYFVPPGQAVAPRGWGAWTRTWIADYSSVVEVYWPLPWRPIDTRLIPARAFDTPEQRERTLALFDEYNRDPALTPQLDAAFARLAEERIRAHPVRFYVALPAARLATIWLRPKTDRLPLGSFTSGERWAFDLWYGAFNLLVLGSAAGAVFLRSTAAAHRVLIALFLGGRSVSYAMLENPEPRYTLVCYAVILAAAGSFLAARLARPAR
jgi:4-amino-4-deoxy-L-arabinose transferase-like glycosyltransferase